MWNIFSTLLFLFMETISCDLFMDSFFIRRKKWGPVYTVAAWSVCLTIKGIYVFTLQNYFALKILMALISNTAFMMLRYQGSIWKIFLSACGCLSLLLSCDVIFSMVFEKFFVWRWENSSYSEVYITLITIIAKTIEFLIITLLHRLLSRGNSFYALSGKGWTRFLIFSLFTIVALMSLWLDDGYHDTTVLTIAFGLMLLNVLFYFTMWEVVNKERENQEYRLKQEKSKGQLRLYNSMETAYREQRKQTHEFKNHIGCIQGLLEEGKMDEALHYVNRIQKKSAERDTPVKTGNDIVDIIVNQKFREAVKEHITFVMSLDRLEHFPLQDEDAVILLSNLLENAMEACKHIAVDENRIIKLKMTRNREHFILVVSNKVQEQVNVKNQLVETTKSNKLEHGIGLSNIRELISKYGAEGECKCEEGWFTYTIIFTKQLYQVSDKGF